MIVQLPLLAGWQVAFDVGATPPRLGPWEIDLDLWYWSTVPRADDFLLVPAGPQLALVVRTVCARCPLCGAEIEVGDREDPDEIVAVVREHATRKAAQVGVRRESGAGAQAPTGVVVTCFDEKWPRLQRS